MEQRPSKSHADQRGQEPGVPFQVEAAGGDGASLLFSARDPG
jgi:hypothetical protein